MRLYDVISTADRLKPNRFSGYQKALWINGLQQRIYDLSVEGRPTQADFETETGTLEGKTELNIAYVSDGNCIVLADGPVGRAYDVVGQRVFTDNDYHIITDSDTFSDISHTYWTLTVTGAVAQDTEKVYSARAIFKKNTDELMLGNEHEEMYLYWLLAKIDFFNREVTGYNNNSLMFNELFDAYINRIVKSSPPLSSAKIKYTI